MTFDATLNPVVYEGGIPIFIDTERESWNMRSNLKPYDYFKYLLTEIPKHLDDKNDDFCENLLP